MYAWMWHIWREREREIGSTHLRCPYAHTSISTLGDGGLVKISHHDEKKKRTSGDEIDSKWLIEERCISSSLSRQINKWLFCCNPPCVSIVGGGVHALCVCVCGWGVDVLCVYIHLPYIWIYEDDPLSEHRYRHRHIHRHLCVCVCVCVYQTHT